MYKCLNFFPCFSRNKDSVDWTNINSNINDFSLKGEIKQCKVVSVYDGDTIRVVFPIHNTMYKWNCRLNGVDTPELRTKDETEKKYGYLVRDELRKKILNKIVTVYCGDFDKYGRLLIDVFCENDETSIGLWLIENKYALKYDGGTKKNWGDYLRIEGII